MNLGIINIYPWSKERGTEDKVQQAEDWRQGQMKRYKCLVLRNGTYSSFVRIRVLEPVFKALRSAGIWA